MANHHCAELGGIWFSTPPDSVDGRLLVRDGPEDYRTAEGCKYLPRGEILPPPATCSLCNCLGEWRSALASHKRLRLPREPYGCCFFFMYILMSGVNTPCLIPLGHMLARRCWDSASKAALMVTKCAWEGKGSFGALIKFSQRSFRLVVLLVSVCFVCFTAAPPLENCSFVLIDSIHARSHFISGTVFIFFWMIAYQPITWQHLSALRRADLVQCQNGAEGGSKWLWTLLFGAKRATSPTVTETAVYLLGLSPRRIHLLRRTVPNRENNQWSAVK